MKEYKSIFIAAILGISAIICVFIGTKGLSATKYLSKSSSISITGSASMEVDADQAVLRGTILGSFDTEKDAWAEAKIAKQYFLDQGITTDELYLSAPDISPAYDYYDDYYDENSTEETMTLETESQGGYDFKQEFSISVNDIGKIEKLTIADGIIPTSNLVITSSLPEYYCTKTDELKLKLMEAATQDAKAQLNILLKDSGNTANSFSAVNVGTFQITGNEKSNASTLYDDYSYEDTYDTKAAQIYSSKKTASLKISFRYLMEEK